MSKTSFDKLIGIMARLRGPGGCAWDHRQTHKTLLKYLFEESREVAKAVRSGDMANLEEELGDVLLQVVFHAQIARETGHFTIQDVIRGLSRKLIRRHPHVFTKNKTQDLKVILTNWKKIKAKEKARARRKKSSPTRG